MDKPTQPKSNPLPAANIGQTVLNRANRTGQMLSPWLQRYAATEQPAGLSPRQRPASLTTPATFGILNRLEHVTRPNTWQPDVGSLKPGMTDSFATAVEQRFAFKPIGAKKIVRPDEEETAGDASTELPPLAGPFAAEPAQPAAPAADPHQLLQRVQAAHAARAGTPAAPTATPTPTPTQTPTPAPAPIEPSPHAAPGSPLARLLEQFPEARGGQVIPPPPKSTKKKKPAKPLIGPNSRIFSRVQEGAASGLPEPASTPPAEPSQPPKADGPAKIKPTPTPAKANSPEPAPPQPAAAEEGEGETEAATPLPSPKTAPTERPAAPVAPDFPLAVPPAPPPAAPQPPPAAAPKLPPSPEPAAPPPPPPVDAPAGPTPPRISPDRPDAPRRESASMAGLPLRATPPPPPPPAAEPPPPATDEPPAAPDRPETASPPLRQPPAPGDDVSEPALPATPRLSLPPAEPLPPAEMPLPQPAPAEQPPAPRSRELPPLPATPDAPARAIRLQPASPGQAASPPLPAATAADTTPRPEPPGQSPQTVPATPGTPAPDMPAWPDAPAPPPQSGADQPDAPPRLRPAPVETSPGHSSPPEMPLAPAAPVTPAESPAAANISPPVSPAAPPVNLPDAPPPAPPAPISTEAARPRLSPERTPAATPPRREAADMPVAQPPGQSPPPAAEPAATPVEAPSPAIAVDRSPVEPPAEPLPPGPEASPARSLVFLDRAVLARTGIEPTLPLAQPPRQSRPPLFRRPVKATAPPRLVARHAREELTARGWRFKTNPGETTTGGGARQVIQTASSLDSSPGPGRPLADTPRLQMESLLQRDFSGVRIHRADLGPLNVQAATRGRDVVVDRSVDDSFSQPESMALLGHELTHVSQQTASAAPAARSVARMPAEVGAQEAEANRTEQSVYRFARTGAMPLAPVQRAPDDRFDVPTVSEMAANSPSLEFAADYGENETESQAEGSTETGNTTELLDGLQVIFEELLDEKLSEMLEAMGIDPEEETGQQQPAEPDLDNLARDVLPYVRRLIAVERERRS